MAQMTPQQQAKELEQCIDNCKRTMSDLKELTRNASDTHLVSTIKESVHHLDMCIKECEFASEATM